MAKPLVSLIGIGLIGVIYWFFFDKREKAAPAAAALTVKVEGGYHPRRIRVKQGQPVTLTFIRRDTNSCLEEVVFPDYKIKAYLPLNQPVKITLSPPHPANSGFHCGMNMFHGKIEVV